MRQRNMVVLALIGMGICGIGGSVAQAKDWVGGSSSDWFNGANWNPSGVPGDGETAVIYSTGNQPLLTNSTANLLALTITSGTLTCSNWTTVIRAIDVTIQTTGKITLPAHFTEAMMSNRVYIVCTNFTVDAGGMVDADRRGYGVNSGPGKGYGNDLVGGSGHGGQGGYAKGYSAIPNVAGGGVYDSESAPQMPGSSSPLCYPSLDGSGKGGGVIRIAATGTVTVNGTLTANAGNATDSHGGGGAGGSVYITCMRFQGGASGLVSARGGDTLYDGGDWRGGGGGGGRIAVSYETSDLPSITFNVLPGLSYYNEGGNTLGAGMGTIHLSSTNCLSSSLNGINGRLIVPGFTSWLAPSLNVTSSAVAFQNDFHLTVAGNVTVNGASSQLRLGDGGVFSCSGALTINSGKFLVATGSTVSCGSSIVNAGSLVVKGDLACGADMTITNAGILWVYSGASNAWPQDYGARIVITGNLNIAAASWVYPYSEATVGGSPLFVARSINIASNGGFDAVSRGYGIGYGPGSQTPGDKGTGASHGGKGGMGSDRTPSRNTYGSSNAPVTAGSGANWSYGGNNKGYGGGVIRLEVADVLTLAGTLDASGGTHLGGSQHGGGGAGGSIFVIARRFESAPGSVIYAKGGTAGVVDNSSPGGGGGAGGRIAVWVGPDRTTVYDYVHQGRGAPPEEYKKFNGTFSVTNGLGYYNGPPDGATSGTVFLLQLIKRGTALVIR